LGGLAFSSRPKGREEIGTRAGRLAGRRQAAQGLPGELQEAEPGRGPAEGQEDEGRGFRGTPLTMIIIRDYLKYLRPGRRACIKTMASA
jgi:hypothetical protein